MNDVPSGGPPDVPARAPLSGTLGGHRQNKSAQVNTPPVGDPRSSLPSVAGGPSPSGSPSPDDPRSTRPPTPQDAEKSARKTPPPPQFPTPPPPQFSSPSPHRIDARAEWLQSRLTLRDWEILETLYRVNLATSTQIQRIHFSDLAQAVHTRKRVLKRLVQWGALIAPPRRVGGPLGGSQQRIYSLDPASLILMKLRLGVTEFEPAPSGKLRAMQLRTHTLTIAELYAQCVELSRSGPYEVIDFQSEPQCWWPLGNRRYLKPDAHLRFASLRAESIDNWWIEVDLGTERGTVIREKFRRYLAYYASAEDGPYDAVPRVLVTTPDQSRATALKGVITRLGDNASTLIHVTPFNTATGFLTTYADAPINPNPEERRNTT